MSSPSFLTHHVKALPPALKAMEVLGYSATQCLQGTHITEADLANPDPQQTFGLEQEFRFHRNLLALTGDPLLGLKLGKAYTLQAYGLLGYAFLSAPTLRHALNIVRNYGPLSFTLFHIDFTVDRAAGVLRFSGNDVIPDDLLTYYVDRDLAAAAFGGESALPVALELKRVQVMHNGQGHLPAYEEFFNCPVTFGASCSELRIDPANLDIPMPLRDAETSSVCQQQCQLLLARMSKRSGFIDKVRQLMVARPGYFPDIDYVAEKLNMTSRTLRRRLADENSSYQQILAELRYQLAREYLGTSSLPLEEISILLGYSAPGNFTHAFKRWHGTSPRQYRQETT
jgi:AraC-like DNA-binding protein